MYIASLLLIWRGNKWGCFVGASAALFWDYVNVFVTGFLRAGLEQAHILLQTGHTTRPDLLISVPAWIGNFAFIVGALLFYLAYQRKERFDIVRLLLAFVATTTFFAGAVALAQPRYLPLFKGALHPHWQL
jgi:ABC-type Fe3+-siderophore transport system permease subunit